MRIPLAIGDVVVAVVSMRDYLLVFTQRGEIFQVEHSGRHTLVEVKKL